MIAIISKDDTVTILMTEKDASILQEEMLARGQESVKAEVQGMVQRYATRQEKAARDEFYLEYATLPPADQEAVKDYVHKLKEPPPQANPKAMEVLAS